MDLPRKKYNTGPKNIVYEIDGSSYGLDDGLVAAIRASIAERLKTNQLEIPRLPQVAARIMQLSQNPETGLDDLVETISTDAGLATRVLVLANSAAYAGGQRVDGLQQALMRLGFNAVRDMVFAESIRMRIFSARAYRALLEESWKLSLGTAIACEALSKETGIERESAFLLGLLHDTGKPVLVHAVSEIERANKGQSLGVEMVEILMSQVHEEIGAHVLERWGMPAPFVEAARDHHRYKSTSATPAQRLVHAGNLVCQHLGLGDIEKDVTFSLERVFCDLDLGSEEKMLPIVETVREGVERMMSGLQDAA